MASIYGLIRNIAVFLIVMQIIMGILPSERYGKYIRLIIGIYVVSMVAFYIRQFDYKEFFQESGYTSGGYEEKLNQAAKSYEEIRKAQYNSVLSTAEEEIKTKLDNYLSDTDYCVESVKIGICDDVDNVDYGKLESIEIIVSDNVDKSGNINVNNIIIGESSQGDDDLIKKQITKYIVEQYGLEERGVKISIQNNHG